MAFQNNSNQEMMSEINVTPLVDVMLVLLVVFLVNVMLVLLVVFIVTAPLLSQSLVVKLPRTAAVAGGVEGQQQTLTIDAKGQISLENIKLSDEILARQLAEAASAKVGFELRVRADESVPYGRVAQIMAIAQHAGVSKLSFMTIAGH